MSDLSPKEQQLQDRKWRIAYRIFDKHPWACMYGLAHWVLFNYRLSDITHCYPDAECVGCIKNPATEVFPIEESKKGVSNA